MNTSYYPGFYKLSCEERLKEISEFAGLTQEEQEIVRNGDSLDMYTASHMIENVVGRFALPIGICTNMKVNGEDILVPLVMEEPSCVAAVSNLAARARKTGGFFTSATEPVMIGQIQLLGANPHYNRLMILEHKDEIMEMCNKRDPVLVSFGGGARDVEARVIETARGEMLIVHLLVNVLDAMGANAINTMSETVSPFLEKLTGMEARLRIISNYADHRLARARVVYKKEDLGGERVVNAMMDAYAFADADVYRCATHNKGVLNDLSATLIATGNDWRAVDSGIHAYAARNGRYRSLTKFEITPEGDLAGSLEVPMAVGTIGGATKIHPTVKIMHKLMKVKSSTDLAQKLVATCLAQNSASLRALSDEGIQRGHMSLHARNVATVAGATGDIADAIAKQMSNEKNVNVEYAKELLKKYQK